MIIVSSAYALTLATSEEADFPIIGWDNLVTVATVSADHANALYPATNLANPSTARLWVSDSTADQHVTALFGGEETVDYIAVARHNWGTDQATVSVEGLPSGGDPDTDGDWDELVGELILADDSPALFRFAPTPLIGVRFKLQPVALMPQAAVIYAGRLLVFERGVQAGHTPIPYARARDVVNPRSQSGEYLGQIVTGGALRTTANIIKLSPDWYRETLDPFFAASAETPFFWAWSPETYPTEVGFAWLTADPMPNPSVLSGHIDVTLQMEGLIL